MFPASSSMMAQQLNKDTGSCLNTQRVVVMVKDKTTSWRCQQFHNNELTVTTYCTCQESFPWKVKDLQMMPFMFNSKVLICLTSCYSLLLHTALPWDYLCTGFNTVTPDTVSIAGHTKATKETDTAEPIFRTEVFPLHTEQNHSIHTHQCHNKYRKKYIEYIQTHFSNRNGQFVLSHSKTIFTSVQTETDVWCSKHSSQ